MYSIARQITRVVIPRGVNMNDNSCHEPVTHCDAPDGYLERSWACVVIGVVGLLLS